jgi:uncharacterized membrane protein
VGILIKFVLFGFAGWIIEVLFTGVISALFQRDRFATAQTYLWMHPIYGAAMLGMEWLGRRMTNLTWLERGGVYLAAIYAVEFTTGWILRRVLGQCPWDYGKRGWSVQGLIRLDYAPAWFAAALLFEPLRLILELAFKSLATAQILAAVVNGTGSS